MISILFLFFLLINDKILSFNKACKSWFNLRHKSSIRPTLKYTNTRNINKENQDGVAMIFESEFNLQRWSRFDVCKSCSVLALHISESSKGGCILKSKYKKIKKNLQRVDCYGFKLRIHSSVYIVGYARSLFINFSSRINNLPINISYEDYEITVKI